MTLEKAQTTNLQLPQLAASNGGNVCNRLTGLLCQRAGRPQEAEENG
ncbi:MAG: hypothetical protein ACRD8U_19230 [Pyrinomonadaceae bacterium]